MLSDKTYQLITDKVTEMGGQFLNPEAERLMGYFIFSINNRKIAAKAEGGSDTSWKILLSQPSGLMRPVAILAGTEQLFARIKYYAS